MSEKKAIGYFRVGNAEQLADDKPAWIYIRKGSILDPEAFDKQRIEFRELCEKQGYRILGETVTIGKGDVSMDAIRNIIESDQGVKHILSPSVACLSRNALEAVAVFDYITKQGVEFKAPDHSEMPLMLGTPFRQIGEAVNFDFSRLVGSGYDEDGETDWDEDEEPDESPHIQM